MIIWLASYPKSGNTWLRLFLKAYAQDDDKNFSINKKSDDTFNVEIFPNLSNFQSMKIQCNGFQNIVENWINAQKFINSKSKLNFIKTHNALCTINNFKFTDKSNTLGGIYIVRDPRDVAVSFGHHIGKSFEEIVDNMIDEKFMISESSFVQKGFDSTMLSTWSNHFNSWKNYDLNKILIIKYEDLVKNTYDEFSRVVKFLNKLCNLEINSSKILKSIELTSFEKLQLLERSLGFDEKTKSQNFFRKGEVGSWKNELNRDLSRKIEKSFENEMITLGYL